MTRRPVEDYIGEGEDRLDEGKTLLKNDRGTVRRLARFFLCKNSLSKRVFLDNEGVVCYNILCYNIYGSKSSAYYYKRGINYEQYRKKNKRTEKEK